ncbi:MAG: hypothetical protein GX822_07715 [Alcaligenaceae bacterium]|nr:hypothetical protein [Alcaligenaceae bacterium]
MSESNVLDLESHRIKLSALIDYTKESLQASNNYTSSYTNIDTQQFLGLSDMNNYTDYIDAKLEAAEARTEARVVRIESMVESFVRSNDDFKQEIRKENKSTRATVIVVSVSSVIAIVIGIAAFNATLTSNMIASYSQGQTTKDNISYEVSKQNQELNDKLDKLIESLGL